MEPHTVEVTGQAITFQGRSRGLLRGMAGIVLVPLERDLLLLPVVSHGGGQDGLVIRHRRHAAEIDLPVPDLLGAYLVTGIYVPVVDRRPCRFVLHLAGAVAELVTAEPGNR